MNISVQYNCTTFITRVFMVCLHFYAPNFEKVGSILLSACPSVRPFVRLFVRPFKKNLKLGF